jgi:hypothetical protein
MNARLDAAGRPLPPTKCPDCGCELDAATVCDENAEEETVRPSPGDLSVCLKCGAILRFTEIMTIVRIQLEDIPDDDAKFQIRRVQQHIRMMNL